MSFMKTFFVVLESLVVTDNCQNDCRLRGAGADPTKEP